jgi:hypothetical protein
MFFKSSDEEGELHGVGKLGAQKKTDEWFHSPVLMF